ncbi:MAG TPA: hypothetical protein VFD25_01570 [Clostridia bacterium]|nr:hypothetical protein [Clostridia bacterium]
MRKTFSILLATGLLICLGVMLFSITASGYNNFFNISMVASGECNSTRAKATTKGTLYDAYYYLPDSDSYGHIEAILYWNSGAGGNFDEKYITDTSTTPYATTSVSVTRLRVGASGFYSYHYARAVKDGVLQNIESKQLSNSVYGH